MITKSIKQLTQEINNVEKKLDDLHYQLKHAYKRKLITCIHCDKKTQLGNLTYIQKYHQEKHKKQWKCSKCSKITDFHNNLYLNDLKHCFKNIFYKDNI